MRKIIILQKLLLQSHYCCRRYATSATSTSIAVQEDLRKSVVIDESKGIFNIDILKQAPSFRLYYAEIYSKNQEIKIAIREKVKNSAPKGYANKTFIQLVDELANELTTAYMVAKTVNKLHSDVNWNSYAKKYLAAFKEMEESLKSDMNIYDALKFSLKTDVGWIDSVDVRAIEGYLAEFEEFGAHLDLDEERNEIVALQSRLNYMCEAFAQGCQKTNDHVNIYKVIYGYLIGRLSGVDYNKSMHIHWETMKTYYRSLNSRSKNWKEFMYNLEIFRVSNVFINFQESWRTFDIRVWLGVDRKMLIQDLSERPKQKFTRWIYNKFLLEANDNQEYVLKKIIKDRHKIAQITGYDSYAQREQENTILGSYDTVKNFLEGIIKEFQPYVEPELEEIRRRVKKNSLEEADIEFALEASRYQSDMPKNNLENLAKIFPFDTFLRGLAILVERLYGMNIRFGAAAKGETWRSAALKLEFSKPGVKDDELLGVVYVNANIKATAIGKLTMSEWILDNTKDVEIDVVRRPKLLGNGEVQTPISVISFIVLRDEEEIEEEEVYSASTDSEKQEAEDIQDLKKHEHEKKKVKYIKDSSIYLTPRTAKNFFRTLGRAIGLIMARPRHQIFAGSALSTDMQELPVELMEQFFYNFNVLSRITHDGLLSLSEQEANFMQEAKYNFGCLKILREATNALFDLEIHGTSAFEYINDDTLTSTELYRSIYKKTFPTIQLRKNIAPQHRFNHLVSHGAKYSSFLIAKAMASLIWHSQFENDPFNKENGAKWAETVSHGGEYPTIELLEKILGYKPEVNQLIETLKKDLIREDKN